MSRIPLPNCTQIPNVLFERMRFIGNYELRVTMALARLYFGQDFHSNCCTNLQLSALTGLPLFAVENGLAHGINGGMIIYEVVDANPNNTLYRLNVGDS